MATSKTYTAKQYFPSGYSITFIVDPKGYITEHFTWEEECNGSAQETVKLLLNEGALKHAIIREEFRNWYYANYLKPCPCNSCFRTISYNKKVGGIPSSKHLTAEASDLAIGEVERGSVKEYNIIAEVAYLQAKYNTVCELIFYSWGIHLGTGIDYQQRMYIGDQR